MSRRTGLLLASSSCPCLRSGLRYELARSHLQPDPRRSLLQARTSSAVSAAPSTRPRCSPEADPKVSGFPEFWYLGIFIISFVFGIVIRRSSCGTPTCRGGRPSSPFSSDLSSSSPSVCCALRLLSFKIQPAARRLLTSLRTGIIQAVTSSADRLNVITELIVGLYASTVARSPFMIAVQELLAHVCLQQVPITCSISELSGHFSEDPAPLHVPCPALRR